MKPNKNMPGHSQELLRAAKWISVEQLRFLIGAFLETNNDRKPLWDIMCALRGPDFPSEMDGMTSTEKEEAYNIRRFRKYHAGEVIRGAAFYGMQGGEARKRIADAITLYSPKGSDHYDRHMRDAARHLGLTVNVGDVTMDRIKVKGE